MTCPIDSAGNNVCMEMIRDNLAQLGRAEGVNCRVIVNSEEPAAPDDWDAPYHCFHYHQYWVRPTNDQLAEWELEEGKEEVSTRLAQRAQQIVRLNIMESGMSLG